MATNTTTYNGQSGVVKYDVSGTPTAVAEVRSFTIDQETATVENTVMGDNDRTYLPNPTLAYCAILLLVLVNLLTKKASIIY